ncbi:MAG: peptidoglycan DD-metalloendopeptidase family protein [Sulfuricurvum sp.]|uniref:murein hydrolase activator EnvC family protein n=1 Tax=Sulfuricurvum sp. TaxID=2025608 RepID=UPI00261990DA|nr:peptidoglycan DD-metalloendopeptidase family protein [Sulfuricurvum sp.]MDD2369151.1 peptidoglycan DD-metalloendopeptidase family protein [Sulfuricurvum sp.]MDD2949540.1 peptidoglycan DD-metalloendopeptidase family protein [Sulfuricurvum sp.]MDD5118746.1 peptidoglycan DD-metalloendopeptidase family protein [Sulfuricurvum sp.]
MKTPFSLLLISFLAVSLPAAKIDEKINKTSKKLIETKQTYSSLSAKLEETASKINQQKQIVGTQEEHINSLVQDLQSKESVYQSNKSTLKELETQQNNLIKTQNEIEQRLVFAIARNTSISLLINDDRAKEADAIITEEALKLHLKQINQEIKELNAMFVDNNEKIAGLSSKTTILKQSIAVIDKQKNKVLETKKENEKAIAKLEKDKQEYKKSLDKILDQQRSLQNTLASLNIIKRESLKPKKAPPTLTPPKPGSKPVPEDVKQAVAEYSPSNVAAYAGERTIAPLDGYVVTKRFGPYTDPVYGIKIFNDSISMRPTEADAKVKTVLNGKVIFAKPTAMLENVIIIEHDNGLHTIYAHLDKIAPTVEVGKRIKQGSIIGRVARELMFEVTQRNAHIDPMQMIR